MKGERIYIKAKELCNKMYALERKLTKTQKQALYKEYLQLLRKAAYSGFPEAQYMLGMQYEDISYLSRNNPACDFRKTVYWYTKAGSSGHPEAYNNLAFAYETGRGCKCNRNKALRLYKKAAESGDSLGRKNYEIMLKDIAPGGRYHKG